MKNTEYLAIILGYLSFSPARTATGTERVVSLAEIFATPFYKSVNALTIGGVYASTAKGYLGKDLLQVKNYGTAKARIVPPEGDLDDLEGDADDPVTACTTAKGVLMILSRLNGRDESTYRERARQVLKELMQGISAFLDQDRYLKPYVAKSLGIVDLSYRCIFLGEIFGIPAEGPWLTKEQYAACIVLQKNGALKDLYMKMLADVLTGTKEAAYSSETDLSWLD